MVQQDVHLFDGKFFLMGFLCLPSSQACLFPPFAFSLFTQILFLFSASFCILVKFHCNTSSIYCGISHIFLLLILCCLQVVLEENSLNGVFFCYLKSDFYLLRLLLVPLKLHRFRVTWKGFQELMLIKRALSLQILEWL